MKKIKLSTKPVCVMLAMVMSYIAVYYAVDNIDASVQTSLSVKEDFYIILDAGHGGYVLSAVI